MGKIQAVIILTIFAFWCLVIGFFAYGLAGAATLEVSSPHYPYQTWLDEAKVPTPDVNLLLVETGSAHGCPGRDLAYAACTDPSQHTIWIAPEAVVGVARKVFYHEIGHDVDYFMLPSWMRSRFVSMYHLSGEWEVNVEPAPSNTPSEIFAEVWAECALKPHVEPGFHLGAGPIFGSNPIGGAERHNAACRMLAKL